MWTRKRKKIMVRLLKIIKKHNIGFSQLWIFSLNLPHIFTLVFFKRLRKFHCWILTCEISRKKIIEIYLKNGKATDVQCSHTFNSLNTLLLCFLNDRKSNAMWCVFGGFRSSGGEEAFNICTESSIFLCVLSAVLRGWAK